MAAPAEDKSGVQSLPESCTSYWVNFVGFMCFLTATLVLRKIEGLSTTALILYSLSAIAVPLIIIELTQRRVFTRESSGLDFSTRHAINWERVAVKWFGFLMTFAIIATIYWLLPEYHGVFYAPFWQLLEVALPIFLVASIPYFLVVDRHMTDPRDGYWHCGMALLGRFNQTDNKILIQYALGWLVKAFFIPLMYVMYLRSYQYVIGADFKDVFSSGRNMYSFFYEFTFLVDLLYACIGYVLTVRLLDTHIRSTEPTMKGWVVAIICYEPFWTVTYGTFLAYDTDGFTWGPWLAGHPMLYFLWGVTIIIFLTMYAASTMTFGLRFSNLTHRGILTNGLYRFTKHPAYVSKNVSWWLIAVPFIADGSVMDAVRDSLLMLGVSIIYYLRARTEEKHLSWDPVYREYATMMNEKSIFRGITRWLPFLRYQSPI